MSTRDIRYQAAIVERRRLLLLLCEPRDEEPFWILPGGGREAGESAEECVAREVQEEAGIEVSVGQLLYDVPADPPDGTYVRWRTYLCDVVSGEAVPGGGEGWAALTAVRWLSLDELAEWEPALCADPYLYPQLLRIRTALGESDGLITLRPLELADAPAVFAAVDRSRDALRRWMVWYSEAYSVTDAEAWIEQTRAARADATGFQFAICDANGMLLGVIGLEDVSATTGRAMVGYWVATPFTGRGVGARAVREALAWAEKQPQISTVWALVAEGNTRSRRVLEANGFRVAETRDQDSRGDVTLVYERELRDRRETGDMPSRTE